MELRQQFTNLTLSEESNAGFDEVARQWLDSVRHTMKPASILRREASIQWTDRLGGRGPLFHQGPRTAP